MVFDDESTLTLNANILLELGELSRVDAIVRVVVDGLDLWRGYGVVVGRRGGVCAERLQSGQGALQVMLALLVLLHAGGHLRHASIDGGHIGQVGQVVAVVDGQRLRVVDLPRPKRKFTAHFCCLCVEVVLFDWIGVREFSC